MGSSDTGIPSTDAASRMDIRVMLLNMRPRGGVFNMPSLTIKKDSMELQFKGADLTAMWKMSRAQKMALDMEPLLHLSFLRWLHKQYSITIGFLMPMGILKLIGF